VGEGFVRYCTSTCFWRLRVEIRFWMDAGSGVLGDGLKVGFSCILLLMYMWLEVVV